LHHRWWELNPLPIQAHDRNSQYMVSAKKMWNSVIIKPNAKFGSANIKNIHLKTPLDQYKCMKMPLELMAEDIIWHTPKNH
jgi:hypothetical protein